MTSRRQRAEDGGAPRRDSNPCDKALYLTENSSDTAATGDFLSRLSVDERDRLLKYGETRDLASMIGATRQWVSSVLAWYEDEGIVVRDGSRLLVLDEERLLDQSL